MLATPTRGPNITHLDRQGIKIIPGPPRIAKLNPVIVYSGTASSIEYTVGYRTAASPRPPDSESDLKYRSYIGMRTMIGQNPIVQNLLWQCVIVPINSRTWEEISRRSEM